MQHFIVKYNRHITLTDEINLSKYFKSINVFCIGKNAGVIFAFIVIIFGSCVATTDAVHFSCVAFAAHFFLLENNKIERNFVC